MLDLLPLSDAESARTQTFAVPQCYWTQPERIRERDRISPRKPVQVEPAREANRVFLRKTPDRRRVVDTERGRCRPLLFLVAPLSQRLVVKRDRGLDASSQGGVDALCGGMLTRTLLSSESQL